MFKMLESTYTLKKINLLLLSYAVQKGFVTIITIICYSGDISTHAPIVF